MELSEDMEAGTYPLTIRLTYKGEVLTEKTVEVEVIGAVLPAMKVPHTEWFHSDCLADYYGVEVFFRGILAHRGKFCADSWQTPL